MLFVKLTILLIVLTIIWRYISAAIIRSEDGVTQYMIANCKKSTWYLNILAVMILLDFVGVIYSTIYFCFLR